MKDIEHLNMYIDWSALTEKEQITLHKLLTKAHSAYYNDMKSTKYRIYHEVDGKKIKTTDVYDNAFDASQRCFWLNENAITAIYGRYVYDEEDKE